MNRNSVLPLQLCGRSRAPARLHLTVDIPIRDGGGSHRVGCARTVLSRPVTGVAYTLVSELRSVRRLTNTLQKGAHSRLAHVSMTGPTASWLPARASSLLWATLFMLRFGAPMAQRRAQRWQMWVIFFLFTRLRPNGSVPMLLRRNHCLLTSDTVTHLDTYPCLDIEIFHVID